MQVISRCFSDAWTRTGYLLFERFRLRRWVSYATLTMLGGSASGGMMPPVPSGSTREKSLVMLGAGAAGLTLPSLPPEVLWIVGAAFLFGLILLLGLAWLSSVAKVVLIENILHDRDALAEPMSRLGSLGTSVFGWSLGSGTVLFGAGAVMLYTLAPAAPSQQATPQQLVEFIFAVMGVMVPLMLAILVVNVVTNEIVVPLMYHGNLGSLSAWGRTLQLAAARPLAWMGWLLVRGLLGVASSCVAGTLSCIVLLFAALAIGVPAFILGLVLQAQAAIIGICALAALGFVGVMIPVVLLIATPFTVLTRCFSLYWLQAMVPDLQLLPAGGRGLVDDAAALPQEVGFTPC